MTRDVFYNQGTPSDPRDGFISSKAQDEVVAVLSDFLRSFCIRNDVGAVLNDGEFVLIAKVAEAFRVGRDAKGVLADDGFCPVADDALDGFRRKVEGFRINVGVDGGRSARRDGIWDDEACEALDDHLVTFTDIHCLEEREERFAAGGEEDRVSLKVPRERSAEFIRFLPLLPFPGLEEQSESSPCVCRIDVGGEGVVDGVENHGRNF